MKKLLLICLALVVISALFGCGAATAPTQSAGSPGASAPSELTIAAASSLTAPLDEIIDDYAAAQPNVKITASYGGSGALQTQIEQGAPVDIFFSAAAKQIDALDEGGLLAASSRIDLLKNEIVLIVPKDSPVKVGSFNDVTADTVSKIAIGDPKSVPAGQYAEDTFTFLKIWDKVSGKAAYATDVRQVLSWVDAGNADCGIVYKTDAISDANVKIIAEAPNGSHTPIVYPIAIVKASANQDAAAAFIKYLQSAEGIAVFIKYGFLTI